MKVPWGKPYIGPDEKAEIMEVIETDWFTMGPKTKKLERCFEEYLGVKHAIAVSNGTAALDIALKIYGIGPGDEVIVPAMTYIATVSQVIHQRAVPVYADIDRDTYTVKPESIRQCITSKTKATITMDYGGNPADYDGIQEVADEFGLIVIEDAAQSLGGYYKSKPLCTFGDIATTSFHAAKVFTTIEGGMIFTSDTEVAEQCSVFRNQGEDPSQKYVHISVGANYRLTDLHAAIGVGQFKIIKGLFKKRKQIAASYLQQLEALVPYLKLPTVKEEMVNGWFFFPILISRRDDLADYLKENGIETRLCYPMPVYRQPAYQTDKDYQCPNAEWVTERIINLPMYFQITEKEIGYVCKTIGNFIKDEKLEVIT